MTDRKPRAMESEQLISGSGSRYVQMRSDTATSPSSFLCRLSSFEPARIFEELPSATIVSFKWRLLKKPSHVFYLHFALKKRAFFEEIHEKQEQVKEWLQNLGIGDHTEVVQDDEDAMMRLFPCITKKVLKTEMFHLALLCQSSGQRSIKGCHARISESLSRKHGHCELSRGVQILGGLYVIIFPEYGPKLKEDYVMVKHLPKIPRDEAFRKCCACRWFSCCNDNWQKVWAVLKPGFLALLADPFDTQPLDIIVFDVLPASDGNGDGRLSLAKEIKERNPLRHAFKVACGNRSINLRVKSSSKVKDWVASINDAGLRPPEGWCHPHRFGSFAPPRGLTEDGSRAQWFIDGRAAFEAIASAIEDAKSEIFICGWWVCPELYLRRPFHAHASSKLDSLLEAKAKEGVQIYILLYKEVALALKINSVYSKRKLIGIHENVRVLRYPDHFSSGVYLWSHHEKLVIVDYQICFLGGLDLCFGRYDTAEHKVGDCPPLVWPGKDYYNPRESEPNSWEDTMKDELDRGKYPRMPWHDVHCALWGPPCRDVARHFVQRWNYAKRNKAPNEQAIPLLMPQHHMVIPHYMGRSQEMEIESKNANHHRRQDSYSSISSCQDIPLLIPQEADGLDSPKEDPNLNGMDSPDLLEQPSRVSNNLAFPFRKSKILPVGHDTPMRGFVDDLDSLARHGKMGSDEVAQPGMKNMDPEWWETQERGNKGGFTDESGQVIRSVSQWSAGTSQVEESIHNAYCSLIDKAEHFIYIEVQNRFLIPNNQFFISGLSGDEIIRNRVLEALFRRIMRAYNDKKCFRVIIVIPLIPGFQGGLDDAGAASVRAVMHWQYRTICRGQFSILQNLIEILGPKTHDYISFYGLRSYGKLFDGGPVACSQVYVHSKIMIVDDCTTLIGSANINDRSLLGSRDSEPVC
ncbi:phospholipase D P1 [Prunus dulcis]|uniref:Phospholipase n=1 Tax=Prunus dulcis TaxID=3755 RepID=A0A4Y1QMZ0_PRUDU|nr:phospholipase D P1 [Prunus dulcis]